MGGGVYCYHEIHVIFEDCVFSSNFAVTHGGAISIGAQCRPTFNRCIFAANVATDGGAISCGGHAHAIFNDCLFVDNYCYIEPGSGGAVECRFNSCPTFDYCTFASNAAVDYGGAVNCFMACSPLFTNCSFWSNSAPSGSAICGEDSCFAEFDNCIIAFGLEGQAAFSQDDSGPSLRCCDVYGNAGGDWVGIIADQYGVNGNISVDPLFCDVDSGDLRLHADSPCLPGVNPECGLIGAWPLGCPSSGIPDDGSRACAGIWIVPNPFTSATRITYLLPENAGALPVMLGVYDAAGRLVRTLAAGVQAPGSHTVSWNGTDRIGRALAGGVYFYRLDMGTERIASRVILLK
jgi:predicted outer membrane repeat protein